MKKIIESILKIYYDEYVKRPVITVLASMILFITIIMLLPHCFIFVSLIIFSIIWLVYFVIKVINNIDF